MKINKCDICKKEIKHSESIDIRVEYDNYELCGGCGAPVLNFLQENNLIDKKEI